jgi:hypothetical protein
VATIGDYFTADGQKRALNAYAEFAVAWPIWEKMELYNLSREAFCGAGGLPAFAKIYDRLNANWQIFRPHGADRCWKPGRIFETLRAEFTGFNYASGVTLVTFSHDKRASLMSSLTALEGIKPNKGYPTMTVSKVLHFFNPSIFPIYDTEVVWNKVFECFGGDYRAFCESEGLNPSACGAAFICNYICWAKSLVTIAAPDFIQSFVDWLQNELPPKRFVTLDKAFLRTLYATVFEFTAIGAAVSEGF